MKSVYTLHLRSNEDDTSVVLDEVKFGAPLVRGEKVGYNGQWWFVETIQHRMKLERAMGESYLKAVSEAILRHTGG